MENKNIAYYEDKDKGTAVLNAKTPEHIWNVLNDDLKSSLS